MFELRRDVRVVGQDDVVPRRRQARRDGGADVAGGAGHENGRHTVTVVRRVSSESNRCTAPRSPICTLSSTAPANGAAAFDEPAVLALVMDHQVDEHLGAEILDHADARGDRTVADDDGLGAEADPSRPCRRRRR